MIKIIPFGCRLNAIEAEKIRAILTGAGVTRAIVVNTCSVTAEAERQSRQMVRKLARENPGAPIFVTGCAATRSSGDYAEIPGVTAVIANKDKLDINAYLHDAESAAGARGHAPLHSSEPITEFQNFSKGFVQIQNGCNHNCAYCIVSKLRGKNVSFPYEKILAEVRALVDNGYAEIVLAGVDIAGYIIPLLRRGADVVCHSREGGNAGVVLQNDQDSENHSRPNKKEFNIAHSLQNHPGRYAATPPHEGNFRIPDLCRAILRDVPGLRRLRLSSLDPGVDLRPLIDLMASDTRMLPHMHLSMQSGSDAILAAMGRRHNARMVRELMASMPPRSKSVERRAQVKNSDSKSTTNNLSTLSDLRSATCAPAAQPYLCALRPLTLSFSWDLICGFPGETPELFDETCALIRELKPIRLHAFPFSPRPGTPAATMPNQVPRAESKRRVKIAADIARENMRAFMESRLGRTIQILAEENNLGRDEHDIPVRIDGAPVPARSVVNVTPMEIEVGRDKEFRFVARVV